MSMDWHGAWLSVIHHPLFGIAITLGAYQLVLAGYEKTRWVFLQPVLISMLVVIGVLVGCGLSYVEYRKSTEILSILLGPATVALAVPLYLNLRRIRQLFWPVLTTLVVGGVLATGLCVGRADWRGRRAGRGFCVDNRGDRRHIRPRFADPGAGDQPGGQRHGPGADRPRRGDFSGSAGK